MTLKATEATGLAQGLKHSLLLWRAWIWFPEPTLCLVPGDLAPSFDFCRHCTYVVHIHRRRQNTNINRQTGELASCTSMMPWALSPALTQKLGYQCVLGRQRQLEPGVLLARQVSPSVSSLLSGREDAYCWTVASMCIHTDTLVHIHVHIHVYTCTPHTPKMAYTRIHLYALHTPKMAVNYRHTYHYLFSELFGDQSLNTSAILGSSFSHHSHCTFLSSVNGSKGFLTE